MSLSRKFLNIWTSFYNTLLNYIFYLPLGGELSFRRKCINFANIEKGDQVLDVCCGTGTLTKLIAKRASRSGRIIGVDFRESILKVAENTRNLPITFICANSENLPLESSRFNKCFISFGLHHMNDQGRRNTLREVRRTLIPNGSLFVVEYNLPHRIMAKFAARVLVKLEESEEAYRMLMNRNLIFEIQRTGFKIRRRKFTGGGMIQLVEACKTSE